MPGLAQYGVTGWQYFGQDRLGSVRMLIDPTGELLLAQSFDPFGNVLERSGAGQSIFGYTGEQVDPSGLIYLRARYYQPATGRFLTPDAIVPDPMRSIGWNEYAYGYNNPVRYTDPSGKNPLCLALVAIDGPIPAGDIACAALLAYTLYAGITVAQQVDLPTGTPPGFNLLPPDAFSEPEVLIPPPPDPCVYNPGPTLGGEFTGPLHLPGPTLEIPAPDTTLDFPLERPEVLGDNILTAGDESVPPWLKSWFNQMQKAPQKRKEQELKTLRKTLAKHEAKYREILESGGYSQEVERMRLQIILLKYLLGEND